MSNSEPTEDLNKMCGKGANEVPKLETVYTFTNFGRNYHRMVESFGRTVATGQYSARESCYKIFEDLLQVTEAQFISSSELIDPELKVHLESARLNNGVTSFGSGPDDTKRMLVFEVRQTDITFKKSQHAITMPIVGGCFCALGNLREVFPGPMFPMSHLLYGIGSEMLAASDCCISDTLSMQLKAEFVNSSWFSQLFQHRIVLPGMALSEFLSLSLQISDLKNDDKSRAELFFISNVRVELQEFTSVSKDGLMSKDTRSITIVESKPDCRVPIGSKFDAIPILLKSSLPQCGPTFFSDNLLRCYGLKILVVLSHQCIPQVFLSSFLELHMARRRHERFDRQDVANIWIKYPGGNTTHVPAYVMKFASDDRTLQRFLSFAKDRLVDLKNEFFRCLLRSYRHTESSKVFLFVLEGSKYVFQREDRYDRGPLDLYRPRAFWHRLEGWQKLQGCREPHMEVRLLNKARSANHILLAKLEACLCLMFGDQTVQFLEILPHKKYRRTFADHSFFLGEEKLPFMTRVTEREYGHSGRFLPLEHAAVTFAGTRLSAFMKIEMISAVGFEEANRKKPMKDVWIQLEHIEIELIELRRLQRRSDYETTVLLHKDLNPLTKPFMWSKFGDRTPGNLRARSMTLPEEVFDCKIPDNVEPYLFCPMSQSTRTCILKVRILFSSMGRKFLLMWQFDLRIAPMNAGEKRLCFDIKCNRSMYE